MHWHRRIDLLQAVCKLFYCVTTLASCSIYAFIYSPMPFESIYTKLHAGVIDMILALKTRKELFQRGNIPGWWSIFFFKKYILGKLNCELFQRPPNCSCRSLHFTLFEFTNGPLICLFRHPVATYHVFFYWSYNSLFFSSLPSLLRPRRLML